MPAISQKRTTIVVSAQPTCSKWCCRGAILNTRNGFPVLNLVTLNTPTWITTDIVMITNSPPSRSSSRSVLVTMARPARTPPRASEPVSPMKILAGGAFHHRKPKQAPITAAATTAASSGSRTS